MRPMWTVVMWIGALAALCLGVARHAVAQETPIAFVNARIIPVEGDEIERGVLVVHRGRILAVGPAASTSVPQGAATVDLAGKTIMPGLVDTHNHIGGVGAADSSGAIQPEVRVFDSINVRDSGFRRAVAGGLTALNIMPGSGHLLSGQTIYVKLRAPSGSPPSSIEDLFIRDAQGQPMWGMKMANGTNPLRDAPFPGTRGKAAAMVRQRFIQAQEYRQKLNAARREDGTLDPEKAPARDLALEALVDVLEGKRIVHHHTHRADDIMTVLRLQREFGFRVVLHHVSEAWKVPKEIAQAGVSCSVIVVDAPGGKLEALNLSWETCSTLERAGAAFSIHTDDWITDSRLFLRSGALAIRGGASRAAVLRALTLEGAAQMDLQDRIGSLKPGKDADFIVLSGDPFSVYTRVEQTYVEGVKVFDLSNPDDRLFAVGGFGAGRDQEVYLCCVGQSGFTFGGKSWGMSSGQSAGSGQSGGGQ